MKNGEGPILHHFQRNKRNNSFLNILRHNMKNGGGFTLIELLVVIAIIGLLSSIVLVALRSARDRAQDKAIMRELNQVRTIAQIILVNTDKYDALCDDSNTLNDDNNDLDILEDAVMKLNHNQNITCYAADNAYCVSSYLASVGAKFCVDGEGIASTVNTDCTDANKTCH